MLSVPRLLQLGLLLQLVACSSTPPQNTSNLCSMFEERRSWYKAAMRAEERWHVPIAVTMAFSQQESGFYGRARPPRRKLLGLIPWTRPSNAFGYAQALEGTWGDYREASGNQGARRSSFADAADFIGWYNNNSFRINAIELSDAYNLYLAYHEGNGGYARRSYADKSWLLETAGEVQANSILYERQFSQCEKALGRNWFLRLFS